jgi:hypothetical protein
VQQQELDARHFQKLQRVQKLQRARLQPHEYPSPSLRPPQLTGGECALMQTGYNFQTADRRRFPFSRHDTPELCRNHLPICPSKSEGAGDPQERARATLKRRARATLK